MTYCVKSIQGDSFYNKDNSALAMILTDSGTRDFDLLSLLFIVTLLVNLVQVGLGVFFAIGIEIADIDLDYFA